MINEPTDFVGNIVAKLIAKALAKPSMSKKAIEWRMIITLSSDYYPVSIIFNDGVSVARSIDSKPTLDVEMNFGTIIELVEGKTSMVKEILNRGIRVKGLLRHPIATFRFYTLMKSILGE